MIYLECDIKTEIG